MRFVNISSDRIIFHDSYEQWELPYGELEKVVPDFLYAHVVPSSDRAMIILNGPGSFTNLRIVTLALNTMNTLHDFSWTFYSITKIDWYAQLFRA
jgi:hypothetical protein